MGKPVKGGVVVSSEKSDQVQRRLEAARRQGSGSEKDLVKREKKENGALLHREGRDRDFELGGMKNVVGKKRGGRTSLGKTGRLV